MRKVIELEPALHAAVIDLDDDFLVARAGQFDRGGLERFAGGEESLAADHVCVGPVLHSAGFRPVRADLGEPRYALLML